MENLKTELEKLSYLELQAKAKELELDIPLSSKKEVLFNAILEALTSDDKSDAPEEPETVEITNGSKTIAITPDKLETLLAPIGVWRKVSDVEAEKKEKAKLLKNGDGRPEGSIKITNGRKSIFAQPFNIHTLLKPLGNWELCEGEKLPDHIEEPKEPEHVFYTRPELMAMLVEDEKKVKSIYEKLTGEMADIDWTPEELATRIILTQDEIKEEQEKKNMKREDLIV